MTTDRWIPDIAGSAAVAAGSAGALYAFRWAGVLEQTRIALLIALPCMTGAALWAWFVNEKGRKMTADEWRSGVVVTLILVAVFFPIDILMGYRHGQYQNFVQAAFHAGSPFGIVLTLGVCPVGTLICLGGWVRSQLLARLTPVPTSDD
jgi:peptidoglycan biosynthesis protein MviN/MurJ (putative lipid II flippase)